MQVNFWRKFNREDTVIKKGTCCMWWSDTKCPLWPGCGRGYKQLRKMSWTEKCPWFQSARMSSVSFLFSPLPSCSVIPIFPLSSPFLEVFFLTHRFKPYSISPFLAMYMHIVSFSHLRVYMTILITGQGKRQWTNTGVPESKTSYPEQLQEPTLRLAIP